MTLLFFTEPSSTPLSDSQDMKQTPAPAVDLLFTTLPSNEDFLPGGGRGNASHGSLDLLRGEDLDFGDFGASR